MNNRADASESNPSTAAAGAILDPTVLDSLRRELGADAEPIISEMLTLFSQESANQLAAFAAAETAPQLARIAHRLRGSALNLGATALADVCAGAEAVALSGDAAAARACLPAIRSSLARVEAAVAEMRRR